MKNSTNLVAKFIIKLKLKQFIK